MASSFSILKTYGEVINPYDWQMVSKALEYKQNKYDANDAAIRSQIEGLENLKLAKGVDQEYLNTRLQTLVQQVNGLGAQDLSSTGVTRNIQGHIKQALDKNVMRAYVGTQNLQKLQAEIADIRKNKPKSYSSTNEAYALQGAMAWMNDGQAGTSYAGDTYIPYTDVMAGKQKALQDLYKNSESSVTVPELDANGQATGRMIAKKFKGLAEEEIGSIFESTLSAQDRKQMEIDSWGTYGQNPEQTVEVFNRYATNRKQELSDSLLEAQKLNDTEKIELYSAALENFDTNIGNMGNNVEAIGMYLQKENIMGGLKNSFRKKQIGFEYKNDAAYWNHRSDALSNLKFNHTQRKDQANLNMRQAEFGLKQADLERKRQKDLMEFAQSGQGGAQGVVLPTFIEGDGVQTESFNKVQAFEEEVINSEKSVNSLSENMVNTVLKDQKATIQAEAKEVMAQKGITMGQAQAEVVLKKLNKSGDMSKQALDFKLAHKAYKNNAERARVLHEETQTQFNETLDTKLDLVFETTNFNIRNKYEKALGFELNSLEELSPDQKNDLKKVMVADVINTKLAQGDEQNINQFVNAFSELMGEKVKINKRVSKVRTTVADPSDISGQRRKTVVRDVASLEIEGSDKVKNLINSSSNLRNTFNFGFDNSITEDAGFKDMLSSDFLTTTQENILSDRVVANEGRKVIAINPPINAKDTARRARQQTAFNIIQQSLSDGDTRLVQDGVTSSLPIVNEKFLKSLGLKKDSVVEIVPRNSVEGYTEFRTPTGKSLLIRNEIAMPQLAQAGINIDLGSINKKDVFIANKATSTETINIQKPEYYNKNINFFEEELSQYPLGIQDESGATMTAESLLTPNMIARAISSSNELKEQQAIDLQEILRNANGLQTEVSIDNGNLLLELKDAKGNGLFSNVKKSSEFASVEQAEKEYNKLSRLQTVAPQTLLYTILDSVVKGEQFSYPTYTLSDIKNQIKPKQ